MGFKVFEIFFYYLVSFENSQILAWVSKSTLIFFPYYLVSLILYARENELEVEHYRPLFAIAFGSSPKVGLKKIKFFFFQTLSF